MSKTPISRLGFFAIALSMTAAWTARAGTPSACQFLTPAAVSAALGKPVTGGTISVVDHSGATASNCTYMAGRVMMVLIVDERDTAGAAMKEYQTQLDNSRVRDKDKQGAPDEQKTVLEVGIGEGAFSDDMTNGSVLGITAVHRSRIFTIGIIGAGSVPHERVRNLIQTAVSH